MIGFTTYLCLRAGPVLLPHCYVLRDRPVLLMPIRNYIDDFIMVDLARNGVSGHRGFASICRIVVYHRLDKQKKRVHVYASYKTCTYCNCKCC